MRPHRALLLLAFTLPLFLLALPPGGLLALDSDALKTPLPQDVLLTLADEVRGQEAFNNLVKLNGKIIKSLKNILVKS